MSKAQRTKRMAGTKAEYADKSMGRILDAHSRDRGKVLELALEADLVEPGKVLGAFEGMSWRDYTVPVEGAQTAQVSAVTAPVAALSGPARQLCDAMINVTCPASVVQQLASSNKMDTSLFAWYATVKEMPVARSLAMDLGGPYNLSFPAPEGSTALRVCAVLPQGCANEYFGCSHLGPEFAEWHACCKVHDGKARLSVIPQSLTSKCYIYGSHKPHNRMNVRADSGRLYVLMLTLIVKTEMPSDLVAVFLGTRHSRLAPSLDFGDDVRRRRLGREEIVRAVKAAVAKSSPGPEAPPAAAPAPAPAPEWGALEAELAGELC